MRLMNIEPFITIAIPAFKSEYLASAIYSALRQTYKNTEIIVVDDCSSNDVKSIVESIADDRVGYYRNDVNLGADDPSRNWNRCLELSKGEFICILCDDDMYSPTYVEEMVKLLGKYPDASVFRGGVSIIGSKQDVVDLFPLAPEHENVMEYIWHLHSGNNRQTISEWMLRVSALREIGGYVNAPKAWGSDGMTIYALGRGSEIITSAERLVFFRMSGINITGMEYSFIEEKIIGWNKQCEMAADVVCTSEVVYKDVILKTIWDDHRRWTKNLIKHATLSELADLYVVRSQYHIKGNLFLKPFFYGLLRFVHLKK